MLFHARTFLKMRQQRGLITMLSSYENWLRNSREISETSINHYTGALKSISAQYNINISEISDIIQFKKIKNSIFSDNSFIEMNKKGNQMYSAALNRYERYLQQEPGWIEIIIDSLLDLNGKATLTEIYDKVSELYPNLATGTFKNTIRARIYENSSDSEHFNGNNDLFYSENKGSGVWGLRNYQLPIIAEEVIDKNLIEGSVKTIAINAYERNIKARKKCIEYYGAVCSVCGFDFSKYYGKEFEGLIHVHHLIPLSEIASEYIIDPIKDLRPVCPNCHLIIHSKPNGTYSIEEVRKMIKNRKE